MATALGEEADEEEKESASAATAAAAAAATFFPAFPACELALGRSSLVGSGLSNSSRGALSIARRVCKWSELGWPTP